MILKPIQMYLFNWLNIDYVLKQSFFLLNLSNPINQIKSVQIKQSNRNCPNVITSKPGGVQLNAICPNFPPKSKKVDLKIAIPGAQSGVKIDVRVQVPSKPGPSNGELPPVAAEIKEDSKARATGKELGLERRNKHYHGKVG